MFNGRLGNNMFQYAVLYAVAKRRPDLKAVTTNWLGVKYFDLDPLVQVSPAHGRPHQEPPGQRFDHSIFELPGGTKLVGFFQTERYFVDLRDDVLRFFGLKPEFTAQLDRALARFKKPILTVHSREGDYVENKLTLDQLYYRRAVERVCQLSQTSIDDYDVVLLSDNPASKSLDFLGPQRFTRMRESEVIDLMIMSRAKHCVISASSFSWWGAWLNRSNPVVVAPDRWFNHSKPPQFGFAPVDVKVSRWHYL